MICPFYSDLISNQNPTATNQLGQGQPTLCHYRHNCTTTRQAVWLSSTQGACKLQHKKNNVLKERKQNYKELESRAASLSSSHDLQRKTSKDEPVSVQLDNQRLALCPFSFTGGSSVYKFSDCFRRKSRDEENRSEKRRKAEQPPSLGSFTLPFSSLSLRYARQHPSHTHIMDGEVRPALQVIVLVCVEFPIESPPLLS